MPWKPKHPCRFPGCAELTEEPYCPTHQRQRERERGSAAARGYDSRWRCERLRFLRSHPLCVACLRERKTTPATVVDHIVPHRGNAALFWDQANWQALCKCCHDTKTATEDGGFGNPAAQCLTK